MKVHFDNNAELNTDVQVEEEEEEDYDDDDDDKGCKQDKLQ